MKLYDNTSLECSRLITNRYSTSFSLGIRTLDKRFHLPVCGIYGFVRLADEIVDTFHHLDKRKALNAFKTETFEAISSSFSLNPVLHAFQLTVNKYGIEHKLINAFLDSMEMDIDLKTCDAETYNRYIYGSAEVVGLMCLHVFVEGNRDNYQRLEHGACKLGAAFQKVNFLRDIQADYEQRGRFYFPGTTYKNFGTEAKKEIENDIEADFEEAYKGILQLPAGARKGVYLAYVYYYRLFNKIRQCGHAQVLRERIRIPDNEKLYLLGITWLKGLLRTI